MVEENRIHDIEKVRRMTLFLEWRENENLAETEGVGGRSEGVCEDVEEAVTDKNRMSFRRCEEREQKPAMVGIGIDDDLAGSVDEPVTERLHVVEEGDRFWRRESRSK